MNFRTTNCELAFSGFQFIFMINFMTTKIEAHSQWRRLLWAPRSVKMIIIAVTHRFWVTFHLFWPPNLLFTFCCQFAVQWISWANKCAVYWLAAQPFGLREQPTRECVSCSCIMRLGVTARQCDWCEWFGKLFQLVSHSNSLSFFLSSFFLLFLFYSFLYLIFIFFLSLSFNQPNGWSSYQ